MKAIILAALLAAAIAPPALQAADAAAPVRTGYAYSVDTGELLYTECHDAVHVGVDETLIRVIYRSASGDLLATKEVRFASDPFMPDFVLENVSTGHVESALGSGDSRAVRFRAQSGDALKSSLLSSPPQGIIDAGFDRLIEEYWHELVNGATLSRPFLVPSRLEFFDFRIRRDVSRERGSRDINVFLLEVDSPWLRWLVKPVEVTYDARSRTLLQYRGISNMRAADGRNYNVRIDFSADGAEAEVVASENRVLGER